MTILSNNLFQLQAGGSGSKDKSTLDLSSSTNTKFTFYGGHNGPAIAEMAAGRFPSEDVGHTYITQKAQLNYFITHMPHT